MSTRRLKLLSANIQAGSSTRGYHDYVARSWSHVLPAGNKRGALDTIAALAGQHDIVGLQESDPGSLRSGFTNQTHYLAERGGFDYWSHQPNRSVGGFASSANALLSKLEPVEVIDHPLPGRIAGRGVLLARFGDGDEAIRWFCTYLVPLRAASPPTVIEPWWLTLHSRLFNLHEQFVQRWCDWRGGLLSSVRASR